MAVTTAITTVAFCLAGLLFVPVPAEHLAHWSSPRFWMLGGVILVGAMAESTRNIGLSTCVTILVPAEGRAKAVGLLVTIMAFGTAPYRRLSATHARRFPQSSTGE